LGGFIMYALGRIPSASDHFELADWRFEVVDMDGNRVDKVLIAKREHGSETAASAHVSAR
jgi:putative hemolysin